MSFLKESVYMLTPTPFVEARDAVMNNVVRIYRPNEKAPYNPDLCTSVAVENGIAVRNRVEDLNIFASKYLRKIEVPVFQGYVLDESTNQIDLRTYWSEVGSGERSTKLWSLSRELDLLLKNPNRCTEIYDLLFAILKKGDFSPSMPGTVRSYWRDQR